MEFDLSLYALKRGHGLLFSLGSPFYIPFFIENEWNHHHYTFILGLAAGLASLPSRLECSLPAEDRDVSNSVLHTGEMKAEFVRIDLHA